ncbi:MAG: hypothetical protein MR842_09895 [Clostridiales bacterium]|nr:hypothetical protein [Clostridiales bacterium]MDO4349215.1 hypothetical protein [Eubacteriales bacterium]MDY4007974.1 hypothetical protein [Candidatus Limiplasma sp.]
MNIPQTDAFERPAPYWLRRAEKSKQAGDLIRAAVLERHAARTDPAYEAAPASYALTLRQLHCYEASNREAFAALAYDPSRFSLYGLIGQNMIALGRRQEAMDAFSMYLDGPRDQLDALPPWDSDVLDMEEAYYEPPIRRRARLNGLLGMALRHMGQGDMTGARRALIRARRKPFQGQYARREELTALYLELAGQPERALVFARRVIKLRPYDAQLAASAACLFSRLGSGKEASDALLRAAVHAKSPADELLVCLASEQLNAPQAAYGMLLRSLSHRADRYPICYNLAVCLMKMGRVREAFGYIHLCRELDPDDVPGEVLFNRMLALEGMSGKALMREAAQLSYYGAMSPRELEDCLAPVKRLLHEGPQALAQAMLADGKLWARMLYLFTLPVEWAGGLLPALCAAMPDAQAQRFLRETLLTGPADSQVKRVAAALLMAMGAPAPYAVWQEGRLGYVDPTRAAPKTAAFRERMLTRCVKRAARLMGDPAIQPWAMRQIHRMSAAQRSRVIADTPRVWPLALCVQYRVQHGLGPAPIDIRRMNGARAKALRQALHTLRSLGSGTKEKKPNADH